MPFKSEKQRRYLWANEPEIARDWTDTYGSKIHAADGGIMRLPFAEGDIVDEEGFTFNETRHRDLTKEQFEERFGGDYEENKINWYNEPTLERMWTDPNRPQISKGLGTMKDWTTDKIGSGINWGKMALSGIANKVVPGLGFLMSAFNPGKLRGMNYAEGRYNTQAEYEANRAARQQQARIGYMMDRRAADKSFSQKNLNALTMASKPGYYGNEWGGEGSGMTGGQQIPGSPVNLGQSVHGEGSGGNQGNQGTSDAGHAAAGGSGMHGGRHYDRGGLAGLWLR